MSRENIGAMSAHSTSAAPMLAMLGLVFVLAAYSGAQQSSTPAQTLRQAAGARGIRISAAASSRQLADPELARILGSEFNQLEPENEMKFSLIHPRSGDADTSYDFSGADALVDFAQAHGMAIRGHTLVWYKQVPPWVVQEKHTPQELGSILHHHIRTVVTHYGEKVYAWDVVNEAFNDDGSVRHSLWYDQPGIGAASKKTGYIEQAFRWAREADSNAKLFYNDYDAEPLNRKSDAIYAMARDFKKRGVPLDGIGFQLHVDLKFDDRATLDSFRRNLQRFAALGLEIHFTELDVRLKDSSPESLQAQARLYGKILDACVQVSSCKLIQTWGVTDKYSWVPSWFKGTGWPLLWDADYKPKAAYDTVKSELLAH
jgi:endo-1,4-beta-xylanase